MFKILGADGREYGPVAVDQIKRWIVEGRANRETMAQATGDSGWKPLGQFPEFVDVLGVAPPVVPAVQPGAAAAPAASPAPAVQAAAPVQIAGSQGGDGTRARIQAQQAVTGPAIGLMVTAGLGIAGALLGLVQSVLGVDNTPDIPGLDPQVIHMIRLFTHGPVAILSNAIALGVGVLILFSALRMQKLTNHGLAMAAAIIAMIPCFSPCCLLGLPFGIWALVVLSRPEIKAQFR